MLLLQHPPLLYLCCIWGETVIENEQKLAVSSGKGDWGVNCKFYTERSQPNGGVKPWSEAKVLTANSDNHSATMLPLSLIRVPSLLYSYSNVSKLYLSSARCFNNVVAHAFATHLKAAGFEINKNVCIFYRWTHRNTVLVKHENSSCHVDKSWKKMLWIQFNWYLEFSLAFLSHTVESPFLHDTWVKLLSSEKEVFYCFYWYNFTFNCQMKGSRCLMVMKTL